MINEFGEKIEMKEIEKIAERIRKLPAKKIDLLWHKCGWVDSGKAQRNKALPNRKISKIMNSRSYARKFILALLHETPKSEVLDHLSNQGNS